MGTGNQHLRSPIGAAHIHHIDLDMSALGQFLVGHLLAGHQKGFGSVGPGADLQGHRAVPGVHAGDDAGENLMLFGVEFVVNHAPFGFPEALDNHLLPVARGDASELHLIHLDVHHVPDLEPA